MMHPAGNSTQTRPRFHFRNSRWMISLERLALLLASICIALLAVA